jgi:sulfate adenylyltransferase subunit 2
MVQGLLRSNQLKKSDHLKRLEAESIHIFREALAAKNHNPVMLYSIGKDSAVMLLAKKAFAPSKLPFPLLHVDTGWKFKEMIKFRDRQVANDGVDLIVKTNEQGRADNINPFDHGSNYYTQVMKTEALRTALDENKFTLAFGGARRDEEKSRAKERIISHRDGNQSWDPKNQRPEMWNLYNFRINDGESLRVFPLSNWTELDIWQYIEAEDIDIVPLYFACEREGVLRDGQFIMRDDDRLTLKDGEEWETKQVRFRTLGCYPLTSAVESNATTIADIINETFHSHTSERSGRLIDHDAQGSMEQKKREGYF